MIDFDHFTVLNLPILLRKIKNKSLFKSLLAPLVTFYNQTKIFLDNSKELAGYTGQIGSLEYLLNKTFNNNQSGIYIEENLVKPIAYLWDPEENTTPIYMFNPQEYSSDSSLYQKGAPKFYLWDPEELLTNELGDFIVKVPSSLVFDLNEMKALINRYILAGFNYTIQTYE